MFTAPLKGRKAVDPRSRDRDGLPTSAFRMRREDLMKVILMIKEKATHHGVMMPEELSMLEQLFETIAAQRSLDKRSHEAIELAALIINLYEHDVRQREQLQALLAV